MSTHHKKDHPCPKCGDVITPTAAGLYHCGIYDCVVSHFRVDAYGNAYDITYCADVRGERI